MNRPTHFGHDPTQIGQMSGLSLVMLKNPPKFFKMLKNPPKFFKIIKNFILTIRVEVGPQILKEVKNFRLETVSIFLYNYLIEIEKSN